MMGRLCSGVRAGGDRGAGTGSHGHTLDTPGTNGGLHVPGSTLRSSRHHTASLKFSSRFWCRPLPDSPSHVTDVPPSAAHGCLLPNASSPLFASGSPPFTLVVVGTDCEGVIHLKG